MIYKLLGRIHVGGNNSYNTWSRLSQFLNIEICVIEKTKASILINENNMRTIANKLNIYNKRYDTDFFIE